jgi:hypothetical protein
LQNKIDDEEKKINKIERLEKSLSQTYDYKTFQDKGDYVSRVYLAINDHGYKRILTEKKFRDKILTDSSFKEDIFIFLKENIGGFNRTKFQFDSALKIQVTKEDIENRNKAILLEGQINKMKFAQELKKERLISNFDQIRISLQLLFIFILLFYVLRPFIWLLKWSFNTLKQAK